MKAGYIVKKVYPHLSGIKLDSKILAFLESQPQNVISLLKWESKKYAKASPNIDPLPRNFINTRHKGIFYSTPRNWRRGKDKMPIFFCCSHCNGRAFWNTPSCVWCGKEILVAITSGEYNSTFFSLVDYLYPVSIRPPISNILAQLIEDTTIDQHELAIELKTIKDHIPTTAYVKKNISLGLCEEGWSISIKGTNVPLSDIGIKNKNGFANLYYLKDATTADYKKYFLSKSLAEASGHSGEIGLKKIPLKELIVAGEESILTLIPRNKDLNLGIVL